MNYLRITLLVSLLGALLLSMFSCEDDIGHQKVLYGTLTGVATDANGEPLSGVLVTLSGINEEDVTTTTAEDGSYSLSNVLQKTQSVSFLKDGWLAVGLTITPESFNDQNEAVAQMVAQTVLGFHHQQTQRQA